MKLIACVLLVPLFAIAQDAPPSSAAATTRKTPGRIECTPADADKYEGYNQQECIKLGEIALIGACNKCLIDGKRTKDRVQGEIANMLRQQAAAGAKADCDEGADVFFNDQGIFYDQASKDAWTLACYNQTGAIIKKTEVSSPVPFDLGAMKTPNFGHQPRDKEGGSADNADKDDDFCENKKWIMGGGFAGVILGLLLFHISFARHHVIGVGVTLIGVTAFLVGLLNCD